MDKKAIEQAAVGAVKNSIGVCDFLSAFIADNDKEPSWDGHVYIYKNKNKKKKEIKGRVAVQIKGTENNNFSKSEISFPVLLSDLNNYLNNGGAVFFVVYVKSDGNELLGQIYYATLSPIEIRVLLFEASNQKTKSITLKKFPKNSNEKTMILLNFFSGDIKLVFLLPLFLSFLDFCLFIVSQISWTFCIRNFLDFTFFD